MRSADLDLGPLDSVSMRVTFLPTNQLALQVSAGHLREAEAEFDPHPRADSQGDCLGDVSPDPQQRRPLGDDDCLWVNSGHETIAVASQRHDVRADAGDDADVTDRHTWLGRAEIVGKPAHDLHAHEYGSGSSPSESSRAGTCATSRRGKGSCPASAAPSRRGSYPVSSRTATAALNPASACFSGRSLLVTSCRCEQWIRRP